MKRQKPIRRSALKKPTLAQVQAWQRRPRTKIKPASPKRAKQLRAYTQLRKEFLKRYFFCQVENCINPCTEIHHKAGRRGDMLLAVTTWLPVCRWCHNLIHNKPAWAKQEGYLI